MTELLPPWPLLLAFMAASLVLTLTPGPGVIYIVTRSAMHGRRAGLASVLGVAMGNVVNALAAAVGLAALFAVSSLAFTVVKFAGAIYLIWLGVKMLRSTATGVESASIAPTSVGRVLRDGFLVAALNPKTTLFFAAFMPQFISAPEHALAQSLLLGMAFVIIAGCTDSLYALAASSIAPLIIGGTRRAGPRVAGGILVGLGLFTAFAGPRHR